MYKNETYSTHRNTREVPRTAARDRRTAARVAPGAHHPQSRPQLCQMRQRRRPPAVGPHGQLPWRTDAAVELADRDGSAGAPLADQLSALESSDRGDLRDQPRFAASGRIRIDTPEETP